MEDFDHSQAHTQAPGAAPEHDAAGAPAPSQPAQDETADFDPAWLGDMAAEGPTWFDRWGRRAATWLTGGIAAALLVIGALWLYGERKADSALAVLAMSARSPAVPQPVPAPAPEASAEPAPAPLPPLVLLPREQVDPPPKAQAAVPKVARTAPARKSVAKTAAPTQRRAGHPAPVRKRRADPVLASVSPREAARPPKTGRAEPDRSRKIPGAAPARRCQTGDLARDCLADMCEGDRNAAACQAAARLRQR